MATFEIQLPSGETYEIDAPDGTTDEQAYQYAMQGAMPQQATPPSGQEKFTREFMRQWEGGSEEGERAAKEAWAREQENRAPGEGETLKAAPAQDKLGLLNVPGAQALRAGLEAIGAKETADALDVTRQLSERGLLPEEGVVGDLWKSLTKDSLREIVQHGVKGQLAKGVGRLYEEAVQERLPEGARKIVPPEGYRMPTKEEWESGQVKNRDDFIPIRPEKGLYDTLGELASYTKTHPGTMAGELLKGIIADPEMMIPIVGAIGSPTKAAGILARVRAIAAVGAEGAAIGALTAGAEQFATGEYDSNKIVAGAVLGGGLAAGLSAGVQGVQLWKLRKMIPDAELAAGSVSDGTVSKLMKDLQERSALRETLPTRETAEASGAPVVEVRSDGFVVEHTPQSIKLAVDNDLRVTQQANDLMSGIRRNYATGEVLERGVSFPEAQVAKMRSQNPKLAQKMDEIAEMRDVERAYFEARQWAEENIPVEERLLNRKQGALESNLSRFERRQAEAARQRELEGLASTERQLQMEQAQRSMDVELEPRAPVEVPRELVYDAEKGRFFDPEARVGAVEAAETRIAERAQRGEVPPSEGLELTFDPESGRLRVADPAGVPTPEIVGKDIPKTSLDLATQKREQGRAWDMTAEERIAWDKANREVVSALRQGQAGNVDPKLLVSLAAGAGLGLYALANPDATKRLMRSDGFQIAAGVGLLVGAAAAAGRAKIPGSRVRAILDTPVGKLFESSVEQVAKGLDYVGGSIGTRVLNINPRVGGRMYEAQAAMIAREYTLGLEVHPLAKLATDTLPKENLAALEKALIQNSRSKAYEAVKDFPEVKAELDRSIATWKQLGKEELEVGVLGSIRDDYLWPRVVKDHDGLMGKLGLEAKTQLQKLISDAAIKKLRAGGDALTDAELSKITNQYFAGTARGTGGGLGFAKERKFGAGEIPEELLQFYASPWEAANIRIHRGVKALEMRRFFGKDLKKSPLGEENLKASIGELVEREIAEGRLDPAKAKELKGLVRSWLEEGSMSSMLRGIKNIQYIATIGSLPTTIKQTGDMGTSAFLNGTIETLESAKRVARGETRWTVEDQGLVNRIAEEFSGDAGKTAQALAYNLKWTGFTALDNFTKNVHIDAALSKLEKQVMTPAGEAAFMQKYGPIWGEKGAKEAVRFLKEGRVEGMVKPTLFFELSQAHPVSRLELPQAMLDNPNAGMLYALHTYQLKQADIIRRTAYQKIKNGNTKEGLKDLARYALMMGIGGATAEQASNWIRGDFSAPDWGSIPFQMLKTYGVNEYNMHKMRQEGVGATLWDFAKPPVNAWGNLLSMDRNTLKQISPLLYDWFGGGVEERLGKKERFRRMRERQMEPRGDAGREAAKQRRIEAIRREGRRIRRERSMF